MQHDSKVSIIVPVHNTSQYLEACVKSLQHQTLAEIEIILVENASDDNSLELCYDLASSDERIKVMHIEHADLSTARNNGLAIANSEYVAFVDSDDTVLPSMYETLYGIASDNDLDVLYCNHVKIYEDRPPKYQFSEDGKIQIMTPKEMLKMNFTHKINSNACTMLVRKRLFDDLKFPENMSFEDRAFTFMLVDASHKVGYINKAYYNYYQRKGSICHSMSWKKYYDFAEADCKRLRYIKDSSLFSEEEKIVLSEKSADSLIRRLRHLLQKAKTEDEKKASIAMSHNLYLIPKRCRIPFKARVLRRLIRTFYM